jgi:hypothetical protein
MRFIILGGGCYGSFYLRQLLRARDAEALPVSEIVVVDHNPRPRAARENVEAEIVRFAEADWSDFFDSHLATLPNNTTDQFVPSPFNPHLGLGWLMRLVQHEFPDLHLALEPFSLLPDTPYREQREHGTMVASHADWICPVHCIEPEICPHTRGPRFWDMDVTGRLLGKRLENVGQPVESVHLFHCHHVSYGVGAYPAVELLQAREGILSALRPGGNQRFLIGTISRCHGAFHLLAAGRGMDTVSRHVSSSESDPPHGASRR